MISKSLAFLCLTANSRGSEGSVNSIPSNIKNFEQYPNGKTLCN